MTAPELAELMALHRTGRLAARHPEVRGLLANLAEEELSHAGQLLSRLRPEDVLAAHPGTASATVAITGHGTVSGLVAPLTAELARHGLLLRPVLGDFDGYVTELGDPGSDLYAASPALVLCVLDPAVVFDEVATPWTPADVGAVLDRKLALFERLVTIFGAASTGTLVLNTIPLPQHRLAELVDHHSRAELGALWREANARLLRFSSAHPALVVLDLDPLVTEGYPAVDARLSTYTGTNLSPDLLGRYAREAGHLARQLAGHTKKTLVLDLDGTLWGGVLGDDGVAGIEVAGGKHGDAFQAFQRVVKQLGSQGVLLAVVSKNDPEPVLEVLAQHPDMVLREADFVHVCANWEAKPGNLAELAARLNLDVSSFVFADDSASECGLVRSLLPEVAVVRLDDEPAGHVGKLLRDGWFTVRELTAEDRERGARYRGQARRDDFRRAFDTVGDYLAELGTRVRLERVREPEFARVSQLTLRTNQFNLTTRRLQPNGVREHAESPGSTVLAIHAADRFGDHGLIGALFVSPDEDRLRIDNFLLSCRVFARGIEQACLIAVLRHARAAGLDAVVGRYTPTPKNHRFADFYPRHGFVPCGEDGPTRVFRHDLADIGEPPVPLVLVTDLEGAAP